MPAFQSLQRAGFGGIQYPITSCEVVGGIRDHLHEYPHAAGASPEKLGRRAYVVHMLGNFQATFKAYPNLWPVALGRLRKMWESQSTLDLVIPTIGTIKAYARNWSQRSDNRVLSGEMVQIEYVEDQASNFLVSALVSANVASLQSKALSFNASKALAQFAKERELTVLDAVFNAANAVLSARDLTQTLTALTIAKVQAAVDLCAQADRLDVCKDPANMRLIEDLHALWAALVDVSKDLKGTGQPLRTYVVPATIAVSDISARIYGDTSHAVELLQLNPIEDAFRVRAGTRIRYYPAQQQAA